MPKVDYVVRETASNLAPQLHHHARLGHDRGRVAGARRRVADAAPGRAERHPPLAGRHRVHRVHEARTPPRTRSTRSSRTSQDNPQIQTFTYVDQKAVLRRVQAAVPRPARAGRQRDTPSDAAPVLPGGARSTRPTATIDALGKQFEGKPGVKEVVLRLEPPSGRCSSCRQRLTVGIIVVAVVPAGRRGPADPEHDPHGHVRPPTGDRGHEAGRRHQLVHPRPVHARGPGPGRRSARCWPCSRWPVFKPFFQSWLPNRRGLPARQRLRARAAASCSPSTRCMIVTGCLVGVVGAGVAVTRFLDV